MTLRKAIEILTDLVRNQPTLAPEDRRDAVKLGIEALKFFIEFQRVTGGHQDTRLPGETIDQLAKGEQLLAKGNELLKQGRELLNVDTG